MSRSPASCAVHLTGAACKLSCKPLAGAKTSFKLATGISFADAMARDKARLPEQFADAVFCDEWAFRLEAAARTWQRPHAQDNLM
jgi:phosphatidylinositol glycan class S